MRSLSVKLILAFLAVSLAATGLLALLAGRTTASAFDTYIVDQAQVNLAGELARYYEQTGSWAGVEEDVLPAMPGSGMRRGGQGRGAMRGPAMAGLALADAGGQIIVPGAGFSRNVQVSGEQLAEGLPVEVDGEVVGTVLGRPQTAGLTPIEAAFLGRVNRALLIAAGGAAVMALLLGVLLARTLTRPLREMTAAARSLARGDLGEQVEVRSQDEVGELASAFNQMSHDLAQAASRRRQLTADIAHDLRTPISIIQGHAEALRDGVLPPTPETFALIHEETLRLNRMVEDLRTLSRAEAGELSLVRRPVAVGALLEQLAAAQRPGAGEKGIELRLKAENGLPEIEVDADRMAQALNNLLDNALRHTPAGGTVALAAGRAGDGVWLEVRDSGPGIAAEDLPHVFERFYRGDRARLRHEGGSGLGLAIARSIVEAHGGRIRAESPAGEGAVFTIELPATA